MAIFGVGKAGISHKTILRIVVHRSSELATGLTRSLLILANFSTLNKSFDVKKIHAC